MYKGEVNVQYCQLSALLKTAESLKVKGLAEMTNQNTTLREPEREPDRLRPHSQPSKSTCDSPVDAALTGPSTSTATNACLTSATHTATTNSANTNTATLANAIHSSAHKREAIERCSPSPPKRLQTATTTTATAALEHDRQPQPLDLYQGRIDTIEESGSGSISVISGDRARANETNNVSNSCTSSNNNNNNQQQHRSNTPHGSGTSNAYNNGDEREFLSSPTRSATCSLQDEADIGVALTKIEDVDDYDEDMDLEEDADNSSNEVGLNMKIGSCHASTAAVVPSPLGGIGNAGVAEPESARSTPAATMNTANLPSDLTQRPASRSSRDGAVSVSSSAHTSTLERPSSSGMCGLPTATAISIAGGLSPSAASASGLGSETLPGTSGLGPVQSVPLSLKKEIDISEDDNSNSRHPRSASAGGGLGGGELDYRASHESFMQNIVFPKLLTF
ncbi:protein tramtrack, beta isoform-like [Teleopsis dalmanni]|uniref:protein tramtrack, beta isoform-like n=1 Tax=Teleopsis dalmanni TaxID=139649 RepID=UPI0018CF723C|nr:protein tramtrack, beta isoform-like [Teleopsis dalmanni]